MTRTEYAEHAEFETTRRLLACLINEGLVEFVLQRLDSSKQRVLCLRALSHNSDLSTSSQLVVGLNSNSLVDENGKVCCPIAPEQLELPVKLENRKGDTVYETNPSKILEKIHEWIPESIPNIPLLETTKQMLQNSAENQEKWLQFHHQQKPCDLNSSAIEWERTIIFGHPEHPLHRCLYPESPSLTGAGNLITPELSFISIPDEQLETTGPFTPRLQPLLEKLGLSQSLPGQTIIPCFTSNLPLVLSRLPRATLVQSFQGIADGQASARSVSIKPQFDYNHHLKMSLPFQITGAIRNVKPWQAYQATYMTELVERLAHPDLWVNRETATITGVNMDVQAARTVCCILREDLEPRALAEDQSLIIAAALYHRPAGGAKTYAETLFGLESQEDKCSWLQKYMGLLFQLVIPLLGRGIVLETHSQNVLVRVDRRSKSLAGFAIRDMNGVKIHVPTLQEQGITVDERLAQISETRAASLEALWKRAHRTLIQNHAGFLLRSLGLDNSQGWSILRGELEKVLFSDACPMGSELRQFFWGRNMGYPCFLGAILRGKPLELEIMQYPNILMR
ncbi:uncharacterized protein N7496_002555 [Penicillium cataractarum]|uniref:Uncharacterized protein n=1 Tax=Penicillium cataractarum TaxID=2100454 RepID=A0A9W9VFL1_9EURO|nr:uncharacterized protein N7496_002555 [Penicillium cataractarum]KAJ5380127.1 hypothetical protein N7496_002555 [Penicillium cataractarum]